MNEWLKEFKRLGQKIEEESASTEIHKCRSKTLANRVKSIVDCVLALNISSININDTRVKGLFSLLLVSLEEISDFFALLQKQDKYLGKRVEKYGSDEEAFCKWNDTLQTCVEDLNLPLSGIFDGDVDLDDFNRDMEELNSKLKSILEKVLNLFGSVELAVEANQRLLAQQQIDRTVYKTQKIVKADKDFDTKAIKYDQIIGRGGFGVVWKARYRGELVAIKTVPSSALSDEAITALKTEAEFMKKLSHPRIVACLGVLEYKENYCMVMELCINGNLATFMATNASDTVDVEKRTDLAIDVATGMNYLHKLGVIHRDLKLGNVVLDQYNRGKITDFGLSVIKSNTQTSLKLDERGTPQYMAPESFGLVPVFSTKSDVYAFAILLWELCHWTMAYRGVSGLEIRDSIREGARLPIDSSIASFSNSLISDCWNHNPRARPSFTEILDRLSNRDNTLNLEKVGYFTLKSKKSVKHEMNSPQATKSPRKPISNWQFTRKTLLIISIALIIILALCGYLIYYFVQQKSLNNFYSTDTVSTIFESSKTMNLESTKTMTSESTKTMSLESTKTMTSESTKTMTLESTKTMTSSAIQSKATSSIISTTALGQNSTASYGSSSTQVQNSPSTSVSPTTTVSTACSTTTGPAQISLLIQSNSFLSNVKGLTFDSNGTLYGYSYSSKSLVKVDPANPSPSTVALIPNGGSNVAGGMICQYNNSIYVPAGGYIWKVELLNKANVSIFAGTGVKGQAGDGDRLSATFINTQSCVFDKKGFMWIGDSSLVRVMDLAGYVSTFPRFYFNGVTGLAFDQTNLLVVANSNSNQIYRINTTEYSYDIIGRGDSASAEGQGMSSQIYTPISVAADTYGNVFVSEQNGNVIKMINSSNYASQLASGFYLPAGVAFDTKGILYIADSGNNAIRMMTFPPNFGCTLAAQSLSTVPQSQPILANSTFSFSIFAIDLNNFVNCYGLTIDNEDNLYTSTSNGQVLRITPQKQITILAKISANWDFQGLCYGNRKVYILNYSTIFVLDLDTLLVTTLNSPYSGSRDCVFDKSGNMIVAFENQLVSFNSQSVGSVIPFTCNGCAGVTFSIDGYLLVNQFTSVVSKINMTTYNSSIIVGGACPHVDGQGIAGKACDANGIASDIYGNIFISEYNNNGISWINSTYYMSRISNQFIGPGQAAIDSKGREPKQNYNADLVILPDLNFSPKVSLLEEKIDRRLEPDAKKYKSRPYSRPPQINTASAPIHRKSKEIQKQNPVRGSQQARLGSK